MIYESGTLEYLRRHLDPKRNYQYFEFNSLIAPSKKKDLSLKRKGQRKSPRDINEKTLIKIVY